jgi:hypothetical protein
MLVRPLQLFRSGGKSEAEEMISKYRGRLKSHEGSYLEQSMPVTKIGGDQQTDQETALEMTSDALPVLFHKTR